MTIFGHYFSILTEVIHAAVILALVVLFRSEAFQRFLGFLWITTCQMAGNDTLIWLFIILSAVFGFCREWVSCITLGILFLTILLFRVTNGFGVK